MAYYLVEAETLEDLNDGLFTIVNGGNPIKKPARLGTWEVGYEKYGFVVRKCSLCGHMIESHEDSNYCPNCGAKMISEGKVYKCTL